MSADLKFYLRVRNFPKRMENARRRLRELEVEAQAVGTRDVRNLLSTVNAAWDREVEKAQIEAAQRGQETSMGVDHAS